MLLTARHTALLGLTGTPIQTSTEDPRRLLQVIKGPGPSSRSDEGYVTGASRWSERSTVPLKRTLVP